MSGLGQLTRAIRNDGGPPVAMTGRRGIFNREGRTPPGTSQALESTKAVSTMFGIVNRLSVATASVDWELMRDAGTGNEEDDTPVTSHLALEVFNKPNPFMSRKQLFERVEQHMDLVGEGWMVFGKTGKWPTSIWPVRPDRMAPVPSAKDFLSGYLFAGPDGDKVPLEIDDVMFMCMPDPNDAFRGLGPVQSLLATIDSMRFGTEWNKNTFLNAAEPGGVIEVAANLSDDDFDTFSRRWDEMHRGVAKANRIAMLEGGMKWVSNGYSPKDMQFVQLQTVGRDTIYEAYGMPKSAMGVTENVNKANAVSGKELFSEQLQVPRLDRFKEAFNTHFLPQFGNTAKGLYFRYKNPVPPDREEERQALLVQGQVALALNQCGEYDPEGILEAVGLPAIKLKVKEPAPVPVVVAPPVVPDAPEGAPVA